MNRVGMVDIRRHFSPAGLTFAIPLSINATGVEYLLESATAYQASMTLIHTPHSYLERLWGKWAVAVATPKGVMGINSRTLRTSVETWTFQQFSLL
jgi:hypothetical protein